jgi:hypothetical protein
MVLLQKMKQKEANFSRILTGVGEVSGVREVSGGPEVCDTDSVGRSPLFSVVIPTEVLLYNDELVPMNGQRCDKNP